MGWVLVGWRVFLQVTHLRVPFGFWIMGDIEGDEPYMSGEFHYLLRLLGW